MSGEKGMRKERKKDSSCPPISSPVVIENRFCFMISRLA